MDKIISKYKNGNYNVIIFEDGTKIRYNDLDSLEPEFPESFDMKITNKCPYSCKYCHEKSYSNGLESNLDDKDIQEFLNNLHSGTEIAIGGGAVTYYPQLYRLLEYFKERNIIASITVNQRELYDNKKIIDYLIEKKLIYGLGISFTEPDDDLYNEILKYPNTVIHLIAGVHTLDIFEAFIRKGAKILILGYKNFGRGEYWYKENKSNVDRNIELLSDKLPEYIKRAKLLSFDNLALDQLNVKNNLTDEEWNTFYMGNDGNYTAYVDLVNKQCAKSSTSTERYFIKDFNAMWNELKYKKGD